MPRKKKCRFGPIEPYKRPLKISGRVAAHIWLLPELHAKLKRIAVLRGKGICWILTEIAEAALAAMPDVAIAPVSTPARKSDVAPPAVAEIAKEIAPKAQESSQPA